MSNVALLFPGQGSQIIGMGRDFWNHFDVAKRLFEEAGDAISFDLKKLCFEGNIDDLTLTMNAQPALLTVSVIAFQVYMQEIGTKPAYMAGHSLGEYSALVCAGVLSFRDAVRLVRQRGILMHNADPYQQGTMAAISNLPIRTLQEICEEVSTSEHPVCVACINTDQQFVISGHRQAIQKVLKRSECMGIKHAYLKVSGPYHSPMMQSAAEQFKAQLSQYPYHPAECPIISNVTAKPYQSDHPVVDYLNRQMTEPVRWLESMHYLMEQGVTEVIELGSKQVLGSLMNRITKDIVPYSLGQPSDLTILSDSELRKNKRLSVLKNQLPRLMTSALTSRNYSQDSTAYNNTVKPLFSELQQLKERLDGDSRDLGEKDIYVSIKLCHSILAAKQHPKHRNAIMNTI
ncbi:ACP S-malonyltransferase [Paenibacillus silvae]|uniref:ACP S-malonyltransferase n=1 Tax=Paenibacillus silvae TaxID=1325358 RepID=UPI00259FF69F|nr:ACP S-malonyltransferase [Paenibacillus silvae]MDM5277043.1 ACP S-malonyltransferase [Paenibacillus silvae]